MRTKDPDLSLKLYFFMVSHYFHHLCLAELWVEKSLYDRKIKVTNWRLTVFCTRYNKLLPHAFLQVFWWSIPVQPRNCTYQLGNVGKHSGSLLHDCYLPHHCLCQTTVYEKVHIDSCTALLCNFSGLKTAKLVKACWRLPKTSTDSLLDLRWKSCPTVFGPWSPYNCMILFFKRKCITVRLHK